MFLIDAYCSGHCRVLLRPALQELRLIPQLLRWPLAALLDGVRQLSVLFQNCFG